MSAVRVSRLRVSPVKGLAQDEVDTLELVPDGIRSDRRFVCTDETDRRLYTLDLGELSRARAAWDEAAATLAVHFADGSSVEGAVELESDDIQLRTSSGRPMPGRRVTGAFAVAMSEAAGQTLRLYHVPVGYGSPGPLTVLGDGSLRRLVRELGVDGLDPRRFKMSIELEGVEEHAEDGWEGFLVRVGSVVLRIGGQVPRCAVTTRDPATRARDHDTLRVLLAYRGAMGTGEPPFGVYATVVEPGVVRVGDAVSVSGP